MNKVPFVVAGGSFATTYCDVQAAKAADADSEENVLLDYFDGYDVGPGIWKWRHYFEIYQRHCGKFVGTCVNLLEVGIYSGGSLDMWRQYFGERCHVYGVDIEEACRVYAAPQVSILIGDQSDRKFWNRVRSEVSGIDIVIDDGGHTYNQQRITLEELLPALNLGGVYICEDTHGLDNEFVAYASGLVTQLNYYCRERSGVLRSKTGRFQSFIYSIHFYPYLMVIEKREQTIEALSAPKKGDRWQPFLS